uniref:Beta clamp protein n=1 Tax=Siphoviridae sp. ctg6Y13 TaxID=2826419 RepID=A0A8S5QXP7_9CAUD|nr:MAG TPA: beta clamp protein [Siphoviridae sp. ctg6Y13]
MELKIMKKELLSAVEVAENFISTERACMEHLKLVHIRTDGNDRIEISTSDSVTCAKVRINGHVVKEGRVAIPCKMFRTAIKQAPDTEILIKAYDYKIKITAKNYISEIPLHEYNPGFKEDIVESLKFKIKRMELKEALEKVEFSASSDPENFAVNCVRLETEDNKMTAVGTDTYRLALCETEITETQGQLSASIPLKAVKGLIKALKSKIQGIEETVSVMSDNKGKIVFRLGSVSIRTEPVKLSFPDYRSIIKGLKNDKKVMLNTKVFHVSLRKGLTVAKYNKEAKNGGILDFRGGRLTIKAKDGFAVEYRDTIDTVQTGEDLKISLNLRFLADYLHKSKDSLTVMEMSNERNAVLVRGETDSKWIYLLMPLALRE